MSSARLLIVLVLLAEPSNAFLAAASWPPHRPVPATLRPTMGLNNWLNARSETFWKSSDTSVTATGGGDAGVAGLTKVANSVRMLAAVALIVSLHLTSAFAWLHALKLAALAAIVLPVVLQYLGDIVVSFRRALTPGLAPSLRAIDIVRLTLTLTLTLTQGQGGRTFQRQLCDR